MNLISKYFNYEEKEIVENYFFPIIVGKECIIMRNFGDIEGNKSFSYLIIYERNKEDIINNIDYILIIDDKNEREKAQNYILKNNIWNYFKKIKFSIKEEFKEILNKENEIIGYITRNGELERQEILKKLELEKKWRIQKEI